MSRTADRAALESLHAKLAQVLVDALDAPSEGGTPAALLNVARQFLKDNSIDAPALPGTPTGQLKEKLKDYPFDPTQDSRQH